MRYGDAKEIGDRGERAVSEILADHCGPHERIIDNILLDLVGSSAQIDHVFIDRFGILIVETKTFNALLRGTSNDSHWTACYRRRRAPVPNPIRQNEGHREKLVTALRQQGIRVDSAYVQSIVVFANGNLSCLDLNVVDQARVLDLEGLENHMATRADFAPNAGDLSPQMVDAYESALYDIDMSGDPEVEARHSRLVRGGRGRMPAYRRYRPEVAWPRPARVASASRPTQPAPRVAQIPALAVLAVLLLTSCGLFSCASAIMDSWGSDSRAAISSTGRPATTPPSITTPMVQTPSVQLALQRVREADPALYGAITNRQSPTLSIVGGYTTYTWDYLEKVGTNRVDVKKLSVSLDSSGRMVGISQH